MRPAPVPLPLFQPVPGDALPNQPARARSRVGWWVAGAIWLALLAFGLHEQFLYATTAGSARGAPASFPADSRLPREARRGSLFMFVHPECPCTRASLHELAELLAGQKGKVSPVLVFAPALDATSGIENTLAAKLAHDLPEVVQFADRDGAEAARFGAETSGHVVFYDARGQLRFAGGITGSRGHVGDNVGARTVKQLIQRSAPSIDQHAVFGCPLEDEPR